MNWQNALARNLRTVEDLAPYLPLSQEEKRQMEAILERFPLSIPPYYLSLIDFSDPNDPIRKMAIPSIAETDLSGSFDTSGEKDNTVVEGLQHKYAQTAMLLSTNQCAMYCRHCFRKRLVGLSDTEIAKRFDAMVAYIRAHEEITNVLVSGGDALLNRNDRLETLLSLLSGIDHLDVIRIGSRTPVVFPQRILEDLDLQRVLETYARRKQIFLVTQFNHPRELTEQATEAIRTVMRLLIPVKNQTVLLKGVNDDVTTLAALLRGLTRAGVSPYYVFQCRPVSGVKAQFQVPLLRALDIVNGAKALQNGLGKGFTFCMSHPTGKIEVLGRQADGRMLFTYHEARDVKNLGKVFALPVKDDQAWLPDISIK